ncbi:DUF4349 domain-containing protein [Pseudopedobacter beijingensis]|uniref:DUF4349 domain-containing protein n=1 Tax=Pseudopedobacter beijingensis TaxID=1207056 RepID=A0ABW4IAV7_9SPHI
MKTILSALFIFLLYSCSTPSATSSSEDRMVESEALLATPPTPTESNTQTVDSALKMIKTADISFESDNSLSAVQKVNELLKNLGGYTEQEDNSSSGSYQYTTLKCRVPAVKFEAFIDQLEGVPGKMTGKSIQRKDVTREYVETETSINAQKALLNRYVQLLAKATKMSDMLEIENKLSELKTTIDISENSFNTLKKQIRYSEVQIHITSANSEIVKPSFGKDLKNAFANGISIFKNLVLGLITLWPLWILAIIAIVFFRNYRQKQKAKKQL